jgi:nucleotide-binding universal stress UspA family protein
MHDDNHQPAKQLSPAAALQQFTLQTKNSEMNNILVPCDFSKPAEEAFKFAVKIAGQNKGEIHVLYVIDITFLHGNPTLSHAYAFNVNFLKDIEKEADQKFHIMWEKYAPMTMKIKFRHVISSFTLEIENYIKLNNIDLVVMGTHGEGNATFGSNTEKIVRNSPVPVFSIRKAPTKIKRIVLPLLPKHADENFIKEIKNLQDFFQAKLHLLYINTPLFFNNDPDSNNKLEQFAREKEFNNYTMSVRSDYTVEAGIVHFAKEIDCDLIAMGTHAWKGLSHFFIGSTAEDLITGLTKPIWTLRLE